MALTGTLLSPLPFKAEVPQGSVLRPILFLIFINDLTDSLGNPLYLFADDFTLCRDISHPSDRQAATSSSLSPQTLTKSQTVETQFCFCIHIVHLLRSPLLLIVTCIPCFSVAVYFLPPPCCWCFPFLLLFPFFFTLCPDLFCVITLP